MDKNVLGILSIYLDNTTISSIKILSSNVSNTLFEIESQESYWHAKLTELLDYPLTEKVESWREMYENLSRLEEIIPYYVVEFDYPEIIQHFIDDGWDPLESDIEESGTEESEEYIANESALERAAKFNAVRSLGLILNNSTIEYSPLLLLAVEGQSYDVIKLLLDRNVKPAMYTLSMAASIGNIEILELLLYHPNITPWSPAEFDKAISSAASYGHKNIVKLLLKYNAPDRSTNAVFYAMAAGHVDIVKLLLLETEAELDFSISRLVERAFDDGYTEAIKLVLHAYPDAPRYIDWNTLKKVILESYKRDDEMVKLLMRDLKIFRTVDLYELLTFAVKIDRADIINVLLENKPLNLSMVKTAFQEAIRGGHTSAVKSFLTKFGDELNINRAYNIAVAKNKGYTDIVELLL